MSVRYINIKNPTYYFFNIIYIENLDPNNIKLDEKSYKNIPKKDQKFNSANPLYLLFLKVNGYFEEINENEHLSLVPTNETKKNK